MKIKILYLVFIVMLVTGCAQDTMNKTTFHALDTVISITAPSGHEKTKELIDYYETLLSVTDGELSRLNKRELSVLSREMAEAIETALFMAEMTGGSFDPTVYPIVSAWGFTKDAYRRPDSEELKRLLELVDYKKVTLRDNAVDMPENAMLDLGAIAKGIIADKAAGLLKSEGVTSALLDFGGNIYALGTKNGKRWRVGIQEPSSETLAGSVEVSDKAVVTSGGYRRFFYQDGERYHHIIDPKTGCPADSALSSVTVVAESAALADALSTALFVMGEVRAAEFWRGNPVFEMILIKKDGGILVTEDIFDDFKSERESTVLTRLEK